MILWRSYLPMICCMVFSVGNLVVCCRRIVCPSFGRHNLPCNSLRFVVSGCRLIRGKCWKLTSKSWRFKISCKRGRLDIRSRRATSSSVMLTSIVSAVWGSTEPRLNIYFSEFWHCEDWPVLLILWRQVGCDSIWGMDRIVFRPSATWSEMMNVLFHDNLRCILSSILQDNITATWLNSHKFRAPS